MALKWIHESPLPVAGYDSQEAAPELRPTPPADVDRPSV